MIYIALYLVATICAGIETVRAKSFGWAALTLIALALLLPLLL